MLNYQEQQFELFVKGALTATAVGLDDEYFRRNPIYAQKNMNASFNKHYEFHKNFGQNQNSQWKRRQKDPITEPSTIIRFIILLCIIGIYFYFFDT